MSADRVDVVIIGAGLAGSATAWALARRGRSAVVLEAFQPGHRRGSSHGSARIFRRAYPDPLYVQLTGEAQRLWRQLADEAGEELVLTTGGIDFGPAREQEKLYEILGAFGVPAELISPGEAAEGWPGGRGGGADGRPVVAGARRGRRRRTLGGTADRPAGLAAAAGRDPAAGLPLRAASLGRAAAGLHLPPRGGRPLRAAGRARRRGARGDQDG